MDEIAEHTSAIVIHKPDFDFSQTPLFWRDQSVLKTLFENTFSCTLPLFESFIIHSIQAVADEITDEALKDDIDVFLKQEKNHMLAHTALNNYLITQGYPVDSYAKTAKKHLARYLALPIENKLQIATIMESITCVLSENYLLQSFVEDNRSAPHELLIWHAIEELDHRSIAFRVYIDYMKRHRPNFFVNVFYGVKTSLMIFKLIMKQLYLQKILFKPSSWKDFFWLIGRRGPAYAAYKGLANFLKLSYDPERVYFNDATITEKVARWKRDYHGV